MQLERSQPFTRRVVDDVELVATHAGAGQIARGGALHEPLADVVDHPSGGITRSGELEQVVVSRTGAEPEGTVPRGAVLQRIPVAGEAVAQARGIDGRPIAVPELRGGRDLLHGHHRWRSAG